MPSGGCRTGTPCDLACRRRSRSNSGRTPHNFRCTLDLSHRCHQFPILSEFIIRRLGFAKSLPCDTFHSRKPLGYFRGIGILTSPICSPWVSSGFPSQRVPLYTANLRKWVGSVSWITFPRILWWEMGGIVAKVPCRAAYYLRKRLGYGNSLAAYQPAIP